MKTMPKNQYLTHEQQKSKPPKVAVSELMSVVKGNLAIKLFKSYPQLKKSLIGATIFGHVVTF